MDLNKATNLVRIGIEYGFFQKSYPGFLISDPVLGFCGSSFSRRSDPDRFFQDNLHTDPQPCSGYDKVILEQGNSILFCFSKFIIKRVIRCKGFGK